MQFKRKYPTEELSNSLDKILVEIEKVNLRIENRQDLSQRKPIQAIYIDIVVRIVSHLNLLYILFKNIDEDSHLKWLEHSVGICLRSCLLDCILISEIIHDLDTREGWNDYQIHREVYLIHNSGQLKNILQTLKDIELGKKLVNVEVDVDSYRKLLQTQFPDFFDNNGSLIYDFQASVKTATTKTRNSAFFKEDATEMFGLWDYYSKYEHYGPYSSILLNYSGEKN
ncbi:MAG: hypothetical protein JSS76_14490 [Bacteroidetes bacterium]|nr:hypothetical protein [Bacteroidota bacterium]